MGCSLHALLVVSRTSCVFLLDSRPFWDEFLRKHREYRMPIFKPNLVGLFVALREDSGSRSAPPVHTRDQKELRTTWLVTDQIASGIRLARTSANACAHLKIFNLKKGISQILLSKRLAAFNGRNLRNRV